MKERNQSHWSAGGTKGAHCGPGRVIPKFLGFWCISALIRRLVDCRHEYAIAPSIGEFPEAVSEADGTRRPLLEVVRWARLSCCTTAKGQGANHEVRKEMVFSVFVSNQL